MERIHYQYSSVRKSELKQHKKRLTQDQLSLLESSFSFSNKLDPDRKSQLAQELGLPPRKIAIWYQNKRARWKNESLEVDYKTLKLKFETLLADNQRMQSEVDRLKLDLHKAQEMLFSLNHNHNNNNNNAGGHYSSLSSQLSSSCDEVGSSNLIHDHHHQQQQQHGSKNHLDKLDLFSCLIGTDQGQFGTPTNDHEFFPTSIS